jgi:TetR/AcrR family transcriptional regulator, tetracycline repressor protein
MPATVKRARKRRARGSLSREQVVEMALGIADAEGVEALTMPKVASRLDCGVMSIYGYIDSKEDLLDAIAQRGLRDLSLPRPLPDNSEAILIAWGRSLRRNLLAHPSLPAIFLSRAVIGPDIFRGIEALLQSLARAGMPPLAGVHAVYAVLTYTTGFVAWEIPRTVRQLESVYASSWRRAFSHVSSADFPTVGGVVDELPAVAGTGQFELGLIALAKGLAPDAEKARIPRR